jgi:ketosteroid isomerase-like protein
MSDQLLEQTRRGYEAWNQGDTGWFEQNLTEDFELLTAPDVFPDLEEAYRGQDGFRKFWEVFRSAWSRIDIEVERIEALSDCEINAVVRFDGVGRESGVEASLTFVHWLTYRDGQLYKLRVEMPDERERKLGQPGI